MTKTLDLLYFIDNLKQFFVLDTDMGRNHGLIIAKGKPIEGVGPAYIALSQPARTIKPRQDDQHGIHSEQIDESN